MRKLAAFMPSLDGGGAERVTIILLNALVRRGYAIDLLVANSQGVYRNQLEPEINVIDFNKKGVASCLLSLTRYLRAERPAALLSVMNHTNVIAILAKKLSGIATRLVITEHNNAELALKNTSSLKYRLVNHLTKWLYSRVDAIVCVSDGVAESVRRLLNVPESKVCVIYNPVVHQGILTSANQSINLPFTLAENELLIIGVGRLTPQKNFENLIRAFSVLKKIKPAKLVILGEGEERNKLQKIILELKLEESVNMPGFVENPYAWMRHADVFALSSSWEGLPTVLIEALACGCKVVSTDCPSGPSEILEEGKWGELAAVNDHDSLAAAILRVLDRDKSQKLAERLEVFSIDYASNKYAELLFLKP